jgi:hypothetical protein
MQPVFSERLLVRLRARHDDHGKLEDGRGELFHNGINDPNDDPDPDDAGPQLVVTLKQPVAEIYPLPEPLEPECCPDTPQGSNAPGSPPGAITAPAGAPAPPDLLDPVVLATMPPQVARFFLHQPRDPPTWQTRRPAPEQDDGAWCG